MKKLFLTFIIMIFGLGLFANPVSLQSAQTVAVNYYKHIALAKTTDFTVDKAVPMQKDGLTTYYVFTFKSGGFVLVSADDAVMPILGYSDSNTFDTENIPSNVQSMLDGYSKQVKLVNELNIDNSATISNWKNIRNNIYPKSGAKAVANLLTTTWNQATAYDASCPSKVVCGCVAMAMGQVMKFWQCPTYPGYGTGTHSYNDLTTSTDVNYNKVLTVNYGAQQYSWAGMPNSISSANTQIDNLLYHCGVAVNMAYSSAGSGAQEMDIPRALIENFNYQPSAEIQYLSNFSSADWQTMLENELNYGRPVLYAGDDGTEGHSFVFTGYNASNQFYVNWGWGGYDNGYFAVGSLNPALQGTYNLDNCAVVRIRPKSNAPIANFTASTTTPAVQASVTFTDLSTNSPATWSWTFEGGTPSSYVGQAPPVVTYTTAGKYLVALTVTNSTGSDTKTMSKMINVGGTASAWSPQNLGFPRTNVYYNRMVNSIDAVSDNVVWATTVDGGAYTHYTNEYVRTTNGGNTWKPDTITFTFGSNPSTYYCIGNISATDSMNAWAAMYPIMAANGGVLVHTTDGGATWTTKDPGYTSSWLDWVHFFDANNGVVVGDPSSTTFVIYTTSNGGSTWTAATTNPAIVTSETGLTTDFCAKGDTIWFGTTQGRIFKSVNKGVAWTAMSITGVSTANGIAITPIFRNNMTGLAVADSSGTFKGVYKTTNGGTAWSKITPNGYYVKNPDFAVIPGVNRWIDVANWNGIGSSFSTDDCVNFNNIDTGSVQYSAVRFFDYGSGWAGSVFNNTNGGIWKWNPSVFVGINDIPNNSSEIDVYPNPSMNVFNISGVTNKSIINVYNLVGEKIMTKNYDPTSGTLQLDLSGFNGGIYLISIETGNKLVTKRVSLIK